jgi:hypothetical protein
MERVSVSVGMQDAAYYREQASRARRLARGMRDDIERLFLQTARDFDDITEDLERGAIEVRHPELMPQNHC